LHIWVVLRTDIYIDGFNLYYGAVFRTPYKWLDVDALCRKLFPRITINKIRYFTADIKGLPHDTRGPFRQQTYLRALRTISNLTIEKGHFVAWPRLMPQYPLAYTDSTHPPQRPPQKVQVQKREEKGSDVNLATYLLLDCFNNDFDRAIVVSNDSDLALPIKIVVTHFRKLIVVVNPHRRVRINTELIRVSSSQVRKINKKVLAQCQFPLTLTDSKGTFTKPATW